MPMPDSVESAWVADAGTEGAGAPAPGPRVVHWSEMEVKTLAKVTAADFPEAALGMEGGPWRCMVRIEVDPAGLPVSAHARDCPEVFVASAESIAMRYRFFPFKGAEGNIAFDLVINFKPPDDSGSDESFGGFGARLGLAPWSTVADPWAPSGASLSLVLAAGVDPVVVGLEIGARGRGMLVSPEVRLRTTSPISVTGGARLLCVTGSPELRAYLGGAVFLGLDVRPRGPIGFVLEAAPEGDLSFTQGLAARVEVGLTAYLRSPPQDW